MELDKNRLNLETLKLLSEHITNIYAKYPKKGDSIEDIYIKIGNKQVVDFVNTLYSKLKTKRKDSIL